QVRLREAELDLGRARDLAAAGVASRQSLDAAQASRDSFAARLAATRDDVTVAEREVALRRQDVEDTLIRAPFDGVATSKNAQPGEIVSPVSAGGGFTRTGIGTIVDMTSLEIEVDVNEAFIQRVRRDQPVVAKNFFANMAVDPDGILRIYPEFVVDDDDRRRWLDTRTGALIGRKLAARFGWKIGDRIPIQPTFFRPKDGKPDTFEFEIVGI